MSTLDEVQQAWAEALNDPEIDPNRRLLMETWASSMIGLATAVKNLRYVYPQLYGYMSPQDEERFGCVLSLAENGLSALLHCAVIDSSDFDEAFMRLSPDDFDDFLQYLVVYITNQ